MKPATLKLTERGIVALWLIVAIAVVGVVRVDAVTVMLALVFAAALLAARWWSRRNLDRIEVVRRLPETAFAGSSEEVAFVVGNQRAWLEARDLLIRVEAGVASSGEIRPATVQAGAEVEVITRLRVPKRGWHRGGRWQSLASFPAGLFEARQEGDFDDGWLIFPSAALPAKLVDVLEKARLERMLRWRLQHEVSGEFRGIRDYHIGDPMKAIHWPASARAGTLMSRQWDPPAPRAGRIGIVVHSLAASSRAIRPALFEAALRAACGLARHCQSEEVRVSFAAAFDDWQVRRAPDRDRFRDIYECLALAGRGGNSDWEDVKKALREVSADCERVFVIGDAPLQDWESDVAALGLAVPVISVSGESVEVHRPKLKIHVMPVSSLGNRSGKNVKSKTKGHLS